MAIDMTTSFEVVDETTIKRLYYDHPELMPTMDVDAAKDMRYNTEHFRNLLVSGILRGQSVPAMAEELQKSTLSVNYSSAIRAVRTATTSAENGGRQARYEEIAKSGISGMSKQWLATGDERTRESHMMVNGEIVPYDGYFSNGLKYPADPYGAASEVYNCRCTMRMVLDGVNSSSAAQYQEQSIEAFQRWMFEHSVADVKPNRYAITAESVSAVPKVRASGWSALKENRVQTAHKRLLDRAKREPVGTECGILLRWDDADQMGDVLVGEIDHIYFPDMACEYMGLHNHSSGSCLSDTDVAQFAKRKNMMGITAVSNNGKKVYAAFKTDDFDYQGFFKYTSTFEDEIYKIKDDMRRADEESNQGEEERLLGEYQNLMLRMLRGASGYGIEFIEGRN